MSENGPEICPEGDGANLEKKRKTSRAMVKLGLITAAFSGQKALEIERVVATPEISHSSQIEANFYKREAGSYLVEDTHYLSDIHEVEENEIISRTGSPEAYHKPIDEAIFPEKKKDKEKKKEKLPRKDLDEEGMA